jgi:hypothetical protein
MQLKLLKQEMEIKSEGKVNLCNYKEQGYFSAWQSTRPMNLKTFYYPVEVFCMV